MTWQLHLIASNKLPITIAPGDIKTHQRELSTDQCTHFPGQAAGLLVYGGEHEEQPFNRLARQANFVKIPS